MAESIGALSVDLRLLSTKFEQGINGVNRRMDNLGKQASKVNKILGGLLALGGGAALSGLIKGSIDSANRLGDLSNRLGTTVEGLSRLEYAARLTGVSQTTLATGIQRAQRTIAEAANGTGEAVKALDELGLSATKLNELRPEQQFEVLADALEGVPRQSDKVRLAMKLLDSEGVALLQTMKGGSAAIREMGEESDKTGNTVSTKLAESATASNAAMIKLGATFTGITNTIISALGPSLQEVGDWFSSILPSALSFSSKAFNGIRATITYLSARIIELVRVVTYLGSAFSDTIGGIDKNLADIQNSLDATAEGFVDQINGTAEAQAKFDVVTKNSNLSLEDFKGKTEAATEALKNQKTAIDELKAAEKARKETENAFEDIRQGQRTDVQAEREQYAQRLAAIEAFRVLDANNEVLANQAMEAEKLRHEKAITSIHKAAQEERDKQTEYEVRKEIGKYQFLFSNLSSLMNSKSKKLFEIGKKASQANIIVDTAQGIMKAWAMGPIIGKAGAAAVAAAGAVQLKAVRSQSFSGGGTINASSSGGSPDSFAPSQPLIPQGPTTDTDEGRAIHLHVHGNVVSNDAEKLFEDLSEYMQASDVVWIQGGAI